MILALESRLVLKIGCLTKDSTHQSYKIHISTLYSWESGIFLTLAIHYLEMDTRLTSIHAKVFQLVHNPITWQIFYAKNNQKRLTWIRCMHPFTHVVCIMNSSNPIWNWTRRSFEISVKAHRIFLEFVNQMRKVHFKMHPQTVWLLNLSKQRKSFYSVPNILWELRIYLD